MQSEKEQLAAVMERYGIEWEHKNTHEKHLSVLDYKKQEREKEIGQLEKQLSGKQEEYEVLSDRIKNYDRGVESLETLDQVLDSAPEYQLAEPQGLMSAKTYRNKVAEPLMQKLKSLMKTILAKGFETWEKYYRLDIANRDLWCENERLMKVNAKLADENGHLRAENKDYKFLRKVLGRKQMDNLLIQAQEIQQSKKYRRNSRNKQAER